MVEVLAELGILRYAVACGGRCRHELAASLSFDDRCGGWLEIVAAAGVARWRAAAVGGGVGIELIARHGAFFRALSAPLFAAIRINVFLFLWPKVLIDADAAKDDKAVIVRDGIRAHAQQHLLVVDERIVIVVIVLGIIALLFLLFLTCIALIRSEIFRVEFLLFILVMAAILLTGAVDGAVSR